MRTEYPRRAFNRIAPKRVGHRLKFAACNERQKYGDHGMRCPSVAGRAGGTHAKERLAKAHYASRTLTARASTQRCRKSALVSMHDG